MTCTKCGGLVIDDCGDERCLNCGRRVTDPAREPEPVPVKESIMPGGPWTPERRAKFEATMAEKKAAREQKTTEPKKQRGGAVSTQLVRSAVAMGNAAVRRGRTPKVRVLPAAGIEAVRGIDEAIIRLQDDLGTLERAKQILARSWK